MAIECPGCRSKGLLQMLTVLKDDLAEWSFLEVQGWDLAHSRQIVPEGQRGRYHNAREGMKGSNVQVI